LNIALGNWLLVSDVGLVNVRALGQGDLEHGDNSAELELVETLIKWLVLVDNGDVGDLVDLVESLDSVLDQLGQVYRTLHSVGHSLDDDGVVGLFGSVEQFPCSLEVSADSDASSDSDLVGGEWLLFLVYSSIGLCHLKIG
jgi:hypothetical protein